MTRNGGGDFGGGGRNHRLRPSRGKGALPAPLARVAVLAGFLGLVALTGCAQPGAAETAEKLPERHSVPPAPEKLKPVRFGKRIALTMLKPESYVLNSEAGAAFEVHHIWRKKPASLENDANLGIYIGPFALPHCRGEKSPGKAVTPRRARETGPRWRSCATSAPGQMAWETFHAAGRDLVVHLFILGRDEAEMNALKRIALTLKFP